MKAYVHAPCIFLLATSLSQHVFAAELSGTWRHEKSLEYFAQAEVRPPKTTVIQIVGNKASFSSACFVALDRGRYVYSGPFQSLLKEGVTEAILEAYLSKNFGVSIADLGDYFEADADADCNGSIRDFLLAKDKC